MTWPANKALPKKLQSVRNGAQKAISPIMRPELAATDERRYIWYGARTNAGRDLPPYYLVYFLLVELLGFRDLGAEEKVAWSVPIEFEGKIYSIEHRKLGLGLFVPDPQTEEHQAKRIVSLIHKGVKIAEPYFEWLADQAIETSELNVTNNSSWLYERYEYLRNGFQRAMTEAHARLDESHTTHTSKGSVTHFPYFQLRKQARWMALAAIDAFFSWTEHVFVQLAILNGTVTTGRQVTELASADWQHKFKTALDLSRADTKVLFDQLVTLKRKLRNFIAHGAFGKTGQAFSFHSPAGAVPVLLTHRREGYRYSISGDMSLDDETAITTIEKFIDRLWSGRRASARSYLESGLPLILTLARDGTYATAMSSADEMNDLVEYLSRSIDQAANMDW